MKVEIKKSPLENLAADVLVVFVAQRPDGKNPPKPGAKAELKNS